MASEIKYLILAIFVTITFSRSEAVGARISLPELATKQNVFNLRFISKDGKYTYYQRRSGELLLSTNFNIKRVLKDIPLTQYKIISSPTRKKLLISKDNNYHSTYDLRKNNEIYSVDFGKHTPKSILKGADPRLHLNDTWCSGYRALDRIIIFSNLTNQNLFFSIDTRNMYNPYFIPERLMISEGNVLFTSLDAKGSSLIRTFNAHNGKLKTVKIIKSPLVRIEMCYANNKIFIGQFGIANHEKKSIISVYSNYDLKDEKVIYKSDQNDPGGIICSLDKNNIYFIKNTYDLTKKNTFEAASLSTEAFNDTKLLTDLKQLTNIFSMDGKLIAQFREKHYLLIGDNNLGEDKLKK